MGNLPNRRKSKIRVFISYTHDSQTHLDQILDLSKLLRSEGVDCRVDQYEQSPAEGWPLWCARQVDESDFVIVACTETYLRRFKGEEVPNIGLGGTWEGHIITQELYNARGCNTKFIPITFSQDDSRFIPSSLQSATRYQLFDHYDQLYRHLTGQPLNRMPPLGSLKQMPSREPLPPLSNPERKQEFTTISQVAVPQNQTAAIADRLRELLDSLSNCRSYDLNPPPTIPHIAESLGFHSTAQLE
jgi:SEFIR domain-containing protein